MSRSVRFSPEAIERLDEIEAFIADAGSPATAARYVDAIVQYCAGLGAFPMIGIAREDLHPGLRVTHYKGRAVIAYVVKTDAISVIGIFYGGRSIEGPFSPADEDT